MPGPAPGFFVSALPCSAMVAVRHGRVGVQFSRTGRAVQKSIYFIVTVTLAACLSAHGASKPDEDLDECKRMENSAKMVMKARQAGAPMSKLWDVAVNTNNEYLEEMYKMLIRSAYDKPRFSTEEMQERSVMDFQNEYFSACMRNAEKGKKAK